MRALSAFSAAPLSAWKRLAIVLLAVPAILVGLLAMHVLTTGAAHAPDAHGSAGHVSVAVDESATDILTTHSEGTADCDGLCGTEHDMLGMACILALLITALLLIIHLTVLTWGSRRPIASALIARVAALAPPLPPSLLELSISRT